MSHSRTPELRHVIDARQRLAAGWPADPAAIFAAGHTVCTRKCGPMSSRSNGKIAVIGAGPAGLSCTLGLLRKGFEVALFERHTEIRAAGNVINLWPSPQEILRIYGVDTKGMGAVTTPEMRRQDGRGRARFAFPDDIAREYRGGFTGMLRWDLYRRLSAAIPEGVIRFGARCVAIDDTGDSVIVRTEDAEEAFDLVVGTDGIDSVVRSKLWGIEPKREHRLHAILGYDLHGGDVSTLAVIAHNRSVQASYAPLEFEGRMGHGWWVLEAWDPAKPYRKDLKQRAIELSRTFAEPLPTIIRNTDPTNIHEWQIRDRKPLKQWSKGRVTLAGDAAHPTSPYAAYGAGMSIEDGYFLARALAGTDLRDREALSAGLARYESARRPHTAAVSQEAYVLGQVYHWAPRVLRPIRDFVFDHTSMLQKQVGNAQPGRAIAQLKEIQRYEAGAGVE
ncbi:FAD-dependent monooxygenase [Streptomyces sp. NPDC091217]|uniref:FAD-dependent oxidoreductase n=1 Tax=Streptomyces sp. NPDC091217 TaxID=3365975 RepID=UPI0037FF2138